MPWIIAVAITITVAFLVLRFYGDQTNHTDRRLLVLRFVIIGALSALVIVPSGLAIGDSISKSNRAKYHEYWNGWERNVDANRVRCTRDGFCRHTYQCDPYNVTKTDSEGNTTVETRYHDCPYATYETTYVIDTTVGKFTVGRSWLPENPNRHRWRPFQRIPSRIPSGVPASWIAAKGRIDRSAPGPVTKVNTYNNYVLASEQTILRQFSSEVERYHGQKLLPDPAQGVQDPYFAVKVHAVGSTPSGPWNEALARLNSAFGESKQGDLRLVLVNTPKVTSQNADEYVHALHAWWIDPKHKRNGLPKNAVVVVVGTTDGTTVEWARSFTGMPEGNAAMQAAVRNKLPGTPMNLELIGTTNATIDADRTKITASQPTGALADILWHPTDGFKRVSMTGGDDDDVGSGFSYLKSDISASTGSRIITIIILSLLTAAISAAASVIPETRIERAILHFNRRK